MLVTLGIAAAVYAGPGKPEDVCVNVPVLAADVDPWLSEGMRAPASVRTTASQQANGEIIFSSPNQRIAAYASPKYGGSLTGIREIGDPKGNVVDASHPGRLVQGALYDSGRARQGCGRLSARDACCDSLPENPYVECPVTQVYCAHQGTGWDPAQAADLFSNPTYGTYTPSLLGYQFSVVPHEWNPCWNWDTYQRCDYDCPSKPTDSDITMASAIRFLGDRIIELTYEAIGSAYDHRGSWQEFPIAFAAQGHVGDDKLLGHLFSYRPGTSQDEVIQLRGPNDWVEGETVTARWLTWQESATATAGTGLAFAGDNMSWYSQNGPGARYRYMASQAQGPAHRTIIRFFQASLPPYGHLRTRVYLAVGNRATVTQAINQALATRPPFGAVEVPAATTLYTVGQSIAVSGWALDNYPEVTVAAKVRNAANQIVQTVALTRNIERDSDVCMTYPSYAECDTPGVGYSGSVDTTSLTGCVYKVQVIATDTDGNTTVLGERLIVRGGA